MTPEENLEAMRSEGEALAKSLGVSFKLIPFPSAASSSAARNPERSTSMQMSTSEAVRIAQTRIGSAPAATSDAAARLQVARSLVALRASTAVLAARAEKVGVQNPKFPTPEKGEKDATTARPPQRWKTYPDGDPRTGETLPILGPDDAREDYEEGARQLERLADVAPPAHREKYFRQARELRALGRRAKQDERDENGLTDKQARVLAMLADRRRSSVEMLFGAGRRR